MRPLVFTGCNRGRSFVAGDGAVLTCWRPSWREWIALLLDRDLWITQSRDGSVEPHARPPARLYEEALRSEAMRWTVACFGGRG